MTDDNYKNSFSFDIVHTDVRTKARVGKITTPHGEIDTPQFVPVGTQATVKSLSPEDLKQVGTQIIFGNTYHLHLRPGEMTISLFGGLGKFMGWKGVTITDSGGFQVFSLGRNKKWGPSPLPDTEEPFINENENIVTEKEAENPSEVDTLVKITDDKVEFRSHLDGSKHVFTPEKSIEIQHKLGADFIVAFDQCPPSTASYEEVKRAMKRTHSWLTRCVDYHAIHGDLTKQQLVGVVQGGMFADLRKESAEFIASSGVKFMAIGGVSVGESKEDMRKVLSYTIPYLPEHVSKHLLGVGEVDDIFDSVAEGIDTFDCVIPTRFGRYGVVFAGIPEGSKKNKWRIDLTRTVYANDTGPMTHGCQCNVCTTYSRGYMHHLFKANELLAYRLASYHNVYFLLNLTKEIRNAIMENRFEELRTEWLTI